jgi:hypothetical protein
MNQLVSAMKNLILQPPDLTRCSRFWFGLSFSPLQKKKSPAEQLAQEVLATVF